MEGSLNSPTVAKAAMADIHLRLAMVDRGKAKGVRKKG
jgi:hypothetical protein